MTWPRRPGPSSSLTSELDVALPAMRLGALGAQRRPGLRAPLLLRRRRAPRAIAREIIAAARAMLRQGLVVGTVGNVSARTLDGFAITPTRTPYDTLRPRDIVQLDLDGRVVAGRAAPSRESRLHAAVYRARPDVEAVVHTHSVHATAWSFRQDEAPLPEIEELSYYGIAPVATAPPAPAGSAELARGAVAALGTGDVVLLAGHGVLAVGPSVDHALTTALVVERQAEIGWLVAGAHSLEQAPGGART